MIHRLLRWLNAKFNVVETSEDDNGYYAWADTRLDELADQVQKQKEREALEHHE